MPDSTARDQLADLIEWAETDYATRPTTVPRADATAAAILAAGWRPPARTITTVEEAEALPEGTVVLDSEGAALAERVGCLWWYTDPYGPGSLALPATVLYEPKEGE